MDENVRKAYAAMRDAEAEYFVRIERIIAGDSTASSGMSNLIKTMRRARDDFMKVTEPYLRRKAKKLNPAGRSSG
jgi:hypothetical protein